MHNFKELKIWKNSMSLVADVYLLTNNLPDAERFGLISQLRRCSVSLPSNIAEGTSRPSQKDLQSNNSKNKGTSENDYRFRKIPGQSEV